jgi:Uma2 family endonuclease
MATASIETTKGLVRRKRPGRKRPRWVTAADLLKSLGDIPASRVRLDPVPGTATERDLLRNNESKFRTATCELIDGTLVEKPVGFYESDIAGLILTAINNFIRRRRLGVAVGEAGMLRLNPGIVRAPDVSFIARSSFPGGKRPKDSIPSLAPDLAVEVLSRGNTKAEMDRKVREYFAAGSRLVWLINPKTKTARVYASPTQFTLLKKQDTLEGADVLPDFRLPLRHIFDLD